jgi:hypothetical protein
MKAIIVRIIAKLKCMIFLAEYHFCELLATSSRTGNRKEKTAQKAPRKLNITKISG